MRNIEPKSEKNTSVIVLLAAVNRGFLNRLISSIGESVWRSHNTKAVNMTTAMTKAITTIVDDQPFDGPSMMPNSNVARPAIEKTAPSGSRRDCRGSRDLGMMNAPRISAVAATGTFTQNTDCHEKCSSRNPPVIGPSATATPENPAQIAIARPRSLGIRKTLVRMESVDG